MTHQSKIIAPAPVDPMVPRLFRVQNVIPELSDTQTLALEPEDGAGFRFRAGQFNMLYAFGVGEVPISISSNPLEPRPLLHTIRAVGRVSRALTALRPGETLGVRGPFGTSWPLEEAYGFDLLFLAGGVGLAPLRPAILQALAEREKFGSIVILYGARTPEDILFGESLRAWRSRFDLSVQVTVDRATGSWSGRVGVVTQLVKGGGFDRHQTHAFVCGPEVMMQYGIQALQNAGVGPERIHVTLERNMKCAVGLCGHCQFGSAFVCRDGPVFRYDRIQTQFSIPEL